MNTPKTRSELWTNITSSLFSKIDDVFIGTFRAPGGANSRLAAWDPLDKSMRYYNFCFLILPVINQNYFLKRIQNFRIL